MKVLYLLIDFFTVIIPLLFSFHPKIKFYKTWKAFFVASFLVALIFLIWDKVFMELGVWSFNTRYITGVFFWQLPVEEILFFICVPFSCVFTYFCLDKFYRLAWDLKTESVFCVILSTGLLIAGILFIGKLYTSVTFFSTAFVCLSLKFIFKINWFGKAISVYIILLIPFLIVNGILTGTGLEEPVVRYNNSENLNIRLFTIPIEDIFYGFELILLNLFIYLQLLRKKDSRGKIVKSMPKKTGAF
jgi:lycopene cyclase domain-containing protein